MSPLSGLSIFFQSRYIRMNMSQSKGDLSKAASRSIRRAWRRRDRSLDPLVSTMKEHAMKLSARNQLKGKIVEVVKGATTSHVRVDIGGGVIVTSSITNEAVADLALQKGDDAWAVIKASDVMIGK